MSTEFPQMSYIAVDIGCNVVFFKYEMQLF